MVPCNRAKLQHLEIVVVNHAYANHLPMLQILIASNLVPKKGNAIYL